MSSSSRFPSATNIATLFAGATILYIVGLVIYRLYFHPFSKYPGPFLARISYFYAFYHALRGDTTNAQKICHDKYGHIVRYNPDGLTFDEPEANKDIHGPGKNFWKGRAYEPMKNDPDPHARPNLAFAIDKKDHARRKRIIVQAFSDRALRASQKYIKVHIDTLCTVLEATVSKDTPDIGEWSQPMNVENLLYWCAMDITTDLTFGRSYNLLTEPTMRKGADILVTSLNRQSLAFQYPWIFRPGVGRYLDFWTWFLPSTTDMTNQWLGLGLQAAMQRLDNPPEDADSRKDILSYLIAAQDPETGTGIERQDIITEAAVLLLAGGTTVGSALSVIFFYLSRKTNRGHLEKLATELREVFASTDEIVVDTEQHKLDKCTHLHACISESFRFMGAAAWWRDAGPGGAYVTTPSAGATYIPSGYAAGTPWSSTNRSPQFYPDPYAFAPERWIPTSSFYTNRGLDTDEWYARAKAAYHPFGMGPRSCVAKELANLMVLLITAQVVWSFDVRQAEGPRGELGAAGKIGWSGKGETKDNYQLFGSFTLRGEGPVVQFRRR